ncbi:hypothetical protein NY78_3985 [Desulfovibrio sp. TomC]|nr:hypothetical protein NY78_3985 [Desulfovibrio sp. TomC]
MSIHEGLQTVATLPTQIAAGNAPLRDKSVLVKNIPTRHRIGAYSQNHLPGELS